MTHLEKPEDQIETRDRWVIGIAIALVAAPIAGLFVLLLLRSLDPASAADRMFFFALIWFFGAEHLISRYAKATMPKNVPRFFTPTRRKRLTEAAAIAPMVGFCFIVDDAASWLAVRQWFIGAFYCAALLLVIGEIIEFAKRRWKGRTS